MCDFSLHHALSRPAVVGEKLTTHNFGRAAPLAEKLVCKKRPTYPQKSGQSHTSPAALTA